MGNELHVFHTGDSNEYWIATDAADVIAQQAEVHGNPDEPGDIRQLRDEKNLHIAEEGAGPEDGESMTCAEWAAKNGRGLLCACEP